MEGLPKTLAVNEKKLCKYFEDGNHVRVVSGTQEGVTGMVVKVERHALIILSDTTKENICVFADDVVESSEVTSGVTRIGDYKLHVLVLLEGVPRLVKDILVCSLLLPSVGLTAFFGICCSNINFGVIIRVESVAFQVLKGVPDRPEVITVRLREIKSKIDKKFSAQDRSNNTISVKDLVRIEDGPSKDDSLSRFSNLRPSQIPLSPRRFSGRRPPISSGGRHGGGRGRDALAGTTIKVCQGTCKGCSGRVVEVRGESVRVELESQMRVVTVERKIISDNVVVSTSYRDPRYGVGGETPMHLSQTPLRPLMTPMRDPGATPIHDGMRTPMRDRAWLPIALENQVDHHVRHCRSVAARRSVM